MMSTDGAERRLDAGENLIGITDARRRFAANVLSNVAFVGVQAAANLCMTPLLIGYLGIAVFAMVPLANTLVSYIAILGTAYNSTVSRFLAINLEKRNAGEANKVFNTALFGLLGLLLALAPLVLLVALGFSALFHVPAGWEKETAWLFAGAAFGFFISMIASNFSVSPFIHSQFLHINAVNLAALLVRVGLPIALLCVLPPHLWYVGAGLLAGSLVSLLGFALLWRKLTPELHVRPRSFDRSLVGPLAGMGGWIVVNTAGVMLLGNQTALVIVNAFFGAAVTGGYAVAVQFPPLMDYLSGAASGVVRPVILIKYAQGDFAGVRRLAAQSVKLLGLALALPVGLLCGFARPLLIIWLGPSFANLNTLLIVVICYQGLILSIRPLLDVQNAFNKVRWPGIVTLLAGLLQVSLAVLLVASGKCGPTGVALVCAVAWTAKNGLYMPIYTARIMRLPWHTFLPCLGASVAGTLGVAAAAYALSLAPLPLNWLTLALSAAAVTVLYAGVVWTAGLDGTDRQLLMKLSPVRRIHGHDQIDIMAESTQLPRRVHT